MTLRLILTIIRFSASQGEGPCPGWGGGRGCFTEASPVPPLTTPLPREWGLLGLKDSYPAPVLTSPTLTTMHPGISAGSWAHSGTMLISSPESTLQRGCRWNRGVVLAARPPALQALVVWDGAERGWEREASGSEPPCPAVLCGGLQTRPSRALWRSIY